MRQVKPESVKHGVEFLDKHNPGWREKINRETLDLLQADCCILGQLYGNFWDALRGSIIPNRTFSTDWAEERGFYLETPARGLADWFSLTHLWRQELERRLECKR